MALIGKIRQKGWILIATMVLALGGFILMDIMSNSQMYSAADANTLGKVNGKDIRSDEFERYKASIYANSTGNDYQIRQQIWNQFVEDAIVREHAKPLGLGVPKDELMDLQFGSNPANLSPIIMQRFSGQSGQVDMNSLGQIKTAIEQGTLNDAQYADFRTRWSIQENEIIKQRLQDKITAMVMKGIYAPTWQSEMAFVENNQRVDYLYVRVPFDKVPDTDIKVTDDDYAAYLKENPRMFEQTEETRVLDYVAFDVLPTAADTIAIRDAAAKHIAGMTGKDDSLYVVNNNGIYGGGFKSKSSLPVSVADRLMSAPLDSVVGPYLESGAWTVAKILARKTLPDSVRARHILVRDPATAAAKIDSLKNVISSGKATFDEVAKANSEDTGSAVKGGDLGFFGNGAMVPEFNEVCFNTGEQGKLYTATTQFGVHLIEITGKKFITNQASLKAAYISELVSPSKNTQQVVKDKALELMNSAKTLADLEAKAGAMNLKLESSQPLKGADFNVGLLGSGKDARDIVKWAFNKDTDQGEVSREVFTIGDPNGGYFDSKYVVAGLRVINPKGTPSVASIKASQQYEVEIKNRKKAQLIVAKWQGITDLAAAANTYSVTVDTAVGASMMMVNTPKGGAEPRVVGTVFSLAKGQVSKPIAGKTGVYMVQPIVDLPTVTMPADLSMFRNQVKSTAQTMVRANLMNSLKKKADITDNRVNFY